MNKAAEETRRFMQKVYAWMFLGLMVSGITSYIVASTPAFMIFLLDNKILFYGLIIFELVLVLGIVGMIRRISGTFATFLFMLYSFLTGLTLSLIFIAYTLDSIVLVFFIAAGMFGTMSLYGYMTKRDLTTLSQIMMLTLIGIIIASVMNFFLNSSLIDYVTSAIGVMVFAGLTARDTQRIKDMNTIGNEGTDEDRKEAILGALNLYLDLINLFLDLIRLFGKRIR